MMARVDKFLAGLPESPGADTLDSEEHPSWNASEGCCGQTSPFDRSALGCDAAVTQNECLAPREEFANHAAAFIWGADLERDNRVLFRHTATCVP